MKITRFANAYNKTATCTTIAAALESIKTNTEALKARNIYQQQGKSETYQTIKKTLPLVIWSGEFTGKHTYDLVLTNGFMYFDVDDTDNIRREHLESIPQVYALWESISGDGYGGLVKYTGDYKLAYRQLCKDWEANYGIVLDKSCSNINRMNFISYDENLYINTDSTLIAVGDLSTVELAATGTYSTTLEEVIEHIMARAEELSGGAYVKGNYHNYLVQLVSAAVRYGVSYYDFYSNINKYVQLTASSEAKIVGLYQDWQETFGTQSLASKWDETYSYIVNDFFNDSFVSSDAQRINQRWTSDVAPTLNTFQAIKAAKNTGKSSLTATWLETFPEEATEFVFTYRRTLATKLEADLGYANYQNVTEYVKGGKYVVCLHSMHKIPAELRQNAVVVFDEIESVLVALATDTNLKENRLAVWEAFCTLLSTAQGVLLLDADLSEGSFEYLHSVQPRLHLLINDYQPKTGEVIEVVRSLDSEQVLEDIVFQATLPEIVPYIPCSKKEDAEIIHAKLQELGVEGGILLTADTKVDYNDFLSNPNAFTPSYLITSPCFESGNSIENNHYNRILSLYSGTHQSVQSFFQQMARVRADVPTTVYCLAQGNATLIETKTEKLVATLRKASIACGGKVIVMADARTELCAHLESKHSIQVQQPMQAIHAKAEAEGYVVKVIELVAGAGRDDYKALKTLVRAAKVSDILEATDVSMETLAAKSELTSDEAKSLMKARIKHFTQSEALTEEDVVRYLDGKTVETILKVEYLNTYTNAVQDDEKQSSRFSQDKDLREAQVALMTKLNLDYFLDSMDEVTEDDIEQLAADARDNAGDIRALFNINVTKYRKTNTLVKSILKLVGIEATSTKITGGARRGQYILSLTLDTYVQSLIAKREESRAVKRAEEQAELEAQIERSREMTDEELSTYADMLTALYDAPSSSNHPVEVSSLDTRYSYEILC